jgi:hypothetical protein
MNPFAKIIICAGQECKKAPIGECYMDGEKVFCQEHGQGTRSFKVSDNQILSPGKQKQQNAVAAPAPKFAFLPTVNANKQTAAVGNTPKPAKEIPVKVPTVVKPTYIPLSPLSEEISSKLSDDIIFEVDSATKTHPFQFMKLVPNQIFHAMKLSCRRWNAIANRSEFWYRNYDHHVVTLTGLLKSLAVRVERPTGLSETIANLCRDFAYTLDLAQILFHTKLTRAEFQKQFWSDNNGAAKAYSLLVSVFRKAIDEIYQIFLNQQLTNNMDLMEFTIRRYLMQFEVMFPQHKPLVCATDAVLDKDV